MVGNSFVGNKSYLNIGKPEFLFENCYLFIKLLFIMCVCACIYVFLYWDVGPEDSKGCQKPRFTSCLSKCMEGSSGEGCSMACDAEAPQRGPISRSNPGSGPAALGLRLYSNATQLCSVGTDTSWQMWTVHQWLLFENVTPAEWKKTWERESGGDNALSWKTQRTGSRTPCRAGRSSY